MEESLGSNRGRGQVLFQFYILFSKFSGDDEVAAKKEDAPEKSQQENRSLEKSVYRKRYAKIFKV